MHVGVPLPPVGRQICVAGYVHLLWFYLVTAVTGHLYLRNQIYPQEVEDHVLYMTSRLELLQ